MFLVGILFGFLPVYLYSIGYTPLESGIVVSLATLSYLLVQPFAGHLSDKSDVESTVFAGLLVASMAILAATFTAGAALMAVVVLAGLGIGAGGTNNDALGTTLAAQGRPATGMVAAPTFNVFSDMIG